MSLSSIKTLKEVHYKKRSMGRFEYRLEELIIKEQYMFFIPREHGTEKYPTGEYKVIRYKQGPVKIFSVDGKEFFTKPFILNCLQWVENISSHELYDIKTSHNTRLLAYRFIRDLKARA